MSTLSSTSTLLTRSCGRHTVRPPPQSFFAHAVANISTVENEVDFPFSFMQERADISIDTKRKSEAFSTTEEIDVRDGEVLDLTKSSTSSSRGSQAPPSPTQQTTRQRLTRNRESIIPESFQRRSQTFNTIEYGETLKPKGSLLKRLSRTWSRRKSAET